MGYSDCAVETIERKEQYDLSWMDKKIPYLKKGNWLYRFCCFFLGKRKDKLTYKELYLILYGLNRKKLGEEKSKKQSINRILQIYKELHHNKLPKGIEQHD